MGEEIWTDDTRTGKQRVENIIADIFFVQEKEEIKKLKSGLIEEREKNETNGGGIQSRERATKVEKGEGNFSKSEVGRAHKSSTYTHNLTMATQVSN